MSQPKNKNNFKKARTPILLIGILFLISAFLYNVIPTPVSNIPKFEQQTNQIKEVAPISIAPVIPAILTPKDYVAWVQNSKNGLKQTKSFADITFSAQYKPLEYIVCMEERKAQIKESILKQKINELSDMQYFDLKIALNEGNGELLKYQLSPPQDYSERVKYFAFELQKDIVLVEGNDTLSCGLFHFERAYDVTPYSLFLLGFPISNGNPSKNKTLLLYDRIFGNGTIQLHFENDDLQKTPRLKTIQ